MIKKKCCYKGLQIITTCGFLAKENHHTLIATYANTSDANDIVITKNHSGKRTLLAETSKNYSLFFAIIYRCPVGWPAVLFNILDDFPCIQVS